MGPRNSSDLCSSLPPSGNVKYVGDFTTHPSKTVRLGLAFKDVTYDILAGATNLVVEVRAVSTWWNEILALDNIRITSGDALPPADPKFTSIKQSGRNVVVE